MNNNTTDLPLILKLLLLFVKSDVDAANIKEAHGMCRTKLDFFFWLGYLQTEIPKPVRKLIAGTEVHKNWLSGYVGTRI